MVTKRFDAGKKFSPSASAPERATATASEILVAPQNLIHISGSPSHHSAPDKHPDDDDESGGGGSGECQLSACVAFHLLNGCQNSGSSFLDDDGPASPVDGRDGRHPVTGPGLCYGGLYSADRIAIKAEFSFTDFGRIPQHGLNSAGNVGIKCQFTEQGFVLCLIFLSSEELFCEARMIEQSDLPGIKHFGESNDPFDAVFPGSRHASSQPCLQISEVHSASEDSDDLPICREQRHAEGHGLSICGGAFVGGTDMWFLQWGTWRSLLSAFKVHTKAVKVVAMGEVFADGAFTVFTAPDLGSGDIGQKPAGIVSAFCCSGSFA
jgi:hypothetical protein